MIMSERDLARIVFDMSFGRGVFKDLKICPFNDTHESDVTTSGYFTDRDQIKIYWINAWHDKYLLNKMRHLINLLVP